MTDFYMLGSAGAFVASVGVGENLFAALFAIYYMVGLWAIARGW